jgi:hypothetical protein
VAKDAKRGNVSRLIGPAEEGTERMGQVNVNPPSDGTEGGVNAVLIIVVVLILLIVLFFVFGRGIFFGANVNVRSFAPGSPGLLSLL